MEECRGMKFCVGTYIKVFQASSTKQMRRILHLKFIGHLEGIDFDNYMNTTRRSLIRY